MSCTELPDDEEPCGSRRVMETYRGDEAVVRWCGRTSGPCPFPGAPQSRDSDRLCGAGPTRRLRVTWAPDAITAALAELTRWRDADDPVVVGQGSQSLACAIDALRACTGGDE